MLKMIPSILEDFDKYFWNISALFYLFGFLFVSLFGYLFWYHAIILYYINGTIPTIVINDSVGFFGYINFMFHHPYVDFLNYYLLHSSSERFWLFISVYPCAILIYTIIFSIVAGIMYVTIWEKIIAPTVGNIIKPIIDSAFSGFKN